LHKYSCWEWTQVSSIFCNWSQTIQKDVSQSHTAIVTGAANGIGRAVALRLASDGFNVAICDISSQEAALKVLKAEIEAKGQKALAVVANVSVEKEVNDFVSTVVSQFGGLDVVRIPFDDFPI